MLWGWLIYSKGTHIHTQSHKSSTHFQQYFDSLPRSGTISREVTQIYKFHYLVFWGFLFLFFPYLYNMPAVPRKQINTWNYFLGGTIQVQIQQGIAPNHKTNDNTSLTKKTFCIHMIGGLKINIINHPPKNSRMPDIPLVYPKFKKHWNVNCVVLRCCETKNNLAFSLFFLQKDEERGTNEVVIKANSELINTQKLLREELETVSLHLFKIWALLASLPVFMYEKYIQGLMLVRKK